MEIYNSTYCVYIHNNTAGGYHWIDYVEEVA